MISCWYGAITEPEMRQSSSRNGRRMPARAAHCREPVEVVERAHDDALGAEAAREAGEVDLGDQHRRLGEALEAVEVHLGAVGGVVPDHREAAPAARPARPTRGRRAP